MRAGSWDCLGEATIKAQREWDLKRLKREHPEKAYKYHRVCFMHLLRDEFDFEEDTFCKKHFWTNNPKKLTCNADCSMILHDKGIRYDAAKYGNKLEMKGQS